VRVEFFVEWASAEANALYLAAAERRGLKGTATLLRVNA